MLLLCPLAANFSENQVNQVQRESGRLVGLPSTVCGTVQYDWEVGGAGPITTHYGNSLVYIYQKHEEMYTKNIGLFTR